MIVLSRWHILAQQGKSYARLRYNTGPRGEFRIQTEIDYSLPFAGSEHAEWEMEYLSHVRPVRELASSWWDHEIDDLLDDPFGGWNEQDLADIERNRALERISP